MNEYCVYKKIEPPSTLYQSDCGYSAYMFLGAIPSRCTRCNKIIAEEHDGKDGNKFYSWTEVTKSGIAQDEDKE